MSKPLSMWPKNKTGWVCPLKNSRLIYFFSQRGLIPLSFLRDEIATWLWLTILSGIY